MNPDSSCDFLTAEESELFKKKIKHCEEDISLNSMNKMVTLLLEWDHTSQVKIVLVLDCASMIARSQPAYTESAAETWTTTKQKHMTQDK